MRTDRRTDMMKLIVASRNFANMPTTNVHIVCVCVCVRAHFCYNNNTRKLNVFLFCMSYAVSGAAAELFHNRTKQPVASQLLYSSLPLTVFTVTSTLLITPHPTPHQNKAVDRKSLQCTAVDILTVYIRVK
jgi:hypothetical protein